MSSSDEAPVVKKNSKGKTEKKQQQADFQIKPAKGGPSLDTSTWPLLLKVSKPHKISSCLG